MDQDQGLGTRSIGGTREQAEEQRSRHQEQGRGQDKLPGDKDKE